MYMEELNMNRTIDPTTITWASIGPSALRRLLFGHRVFFFDVFDGGGFAYEEIFARHGLRIRIKAVGATNDSANHNGRHEVNAIIADIKGTIKEIDAAINEVANRCANSDLGDAYMKAIAIFAEG